LFDTALRAIILNALLYTSTGGVLIGARMRKDKLLLQIWDTGVGIASEEVDNIFVEFYQIKSHEKEQKQGLGLGLTISKKLIEILGYTLRLKTHLNKGSLFEVEMQKISSEQIVPLHTTEKALSSLIGKKVLVVDDNENVRAATALLLNKWRAEVHAVSSAEAAQALIEQGYRYDVYLCDYDLGNNLNGLDLLSWLQEHSATEVLAVLITANTQLNVLNKADRAGFHVIKKPIKPAQLRALLSLDGNLKRFC
jgi:CheY-like chemotaxis protein